MKTGTRLYSVLKSANPNVKNHFLWQIKNYFRAIVEWKITKLTGSMAKGKNRENTNNNKQYRRDL